MEKKKDPYAHRWYRMKYKLGYGAEGAARGESHVGGDAKGVDPRAESDKQSEMAEQSEQEEKHGDHERGNGPY